MKGSTEPSDRPRSANGTGIGWSAFASLPHFPSNLTGFIGERCPLDRGLDRPTNGLTAHTSCTQVPIDLAANGTKLGAGGTASADRANQWPQSIVGLNTSFESYLSDVGLLVGP